MMDTCTKVILAVLGIVLLLLLLMSMSNGTCNCIGECTCGRRSRTVTTVAAYRNPILQGGGCGCAGDFEKVGGSSFAGKVLAKVDTSVHSMGELNAKANGGSSGKDSFVCLGGRWHHATNMDAYKGLITGGGDIRFSQRDVSLIPAGAHGGVLDQTHPAHSMTLDGFLTSMPGGSLSDKKYFAVKTQGGANQWYARK